MSNLIKHQNELEEDYRSKDLLNRGNKILDYSSSKLDKIQNSWIVWLIWPFWCWKTTFINQIIERENKIDSWSKWLNFDAWKYPDRKDLRENFILDMAQNLDKKWEGIVVKELKGKSTSIFGAMLSDWWEYLDKFIPNIREYLFSREKRELHVIESLLKEIFIALHMWKDWKLFPTIYIVIEDIDRSWDAWVYFLQTLNYFLKKINLWKWLKVIAIATIWNIEYRWNLDSYLKCIDYIHKFPIASYNYTPMIHYFLNDRWCNTSLEDFINYISNHYEWFTPRTLKHILRDLNIALEELWIDDNSPSLLDNISTMISVLTAKYLNVQWEKITYLDKRKKEWRISEDGFKSYFLSIATHVLFIQKTNWVPKLLDSWIYKETVVDYSFTDFWEEDNRLICFQKIPWYANWTVHINRKLFFI